jgi:hypothetical protein
MFGIWATAALAALCTARCVDSAAAATPKSGGPADWAAAAEAPPSSYPSEHENFLCARSYGDGSDYPLPCRPARDNWKSAFRDTFGITAWYPPGVKLVNVTSCAYGRAGMCLPPGNSWNATGTPDIVMYAEAGFDAGGAAIRTTRCT